jgi:microcystin-dependent protein
MLAAHTGAAGGEESHLLSVAEMPSHAHSVVTITGTGSTRNYLTVQTNGFNASSNSSVINATGGGGAHNNLPPSLCVHWIIRAQP